MSDTLICDKDINPTCSESIKKQIFAHYEASDYNEPGERYRHLNPNAALMGLLHIARRGAQADPDRAKEVEKIGELIVKYGQGAGKTTACRSVVATRVANRES